jgi:hypothetical protein
MMQRRLGVESQQSDLAPRALINVFVANDIFLFAPFLEGRTDSVQSIAIAADGLVILPSSARGGWASIVGVR